MIPPTFAYEHFAYGRHVNKGSNPPALQQKQSLLSARFFESEWVMKGDSNPSDPVACIFSFCCDSETAECKVSHLTWHTTFAMFDRSVVSPFVHNRYQN